MTLQTASARATHVAVFAAFAAAYFLSAMLRAVTATLAPVFGTELGVSAGSLGLLGSAYFLGFALAQVPLGPALDRYGPRRVQLVLLAIACIGCAAFASAATLGGLVAARALIGVGVSACLMAPLTHFRLGLSHSAQLRANSWMLMTGSLGMVASTAPTQALLPLVGWRGLFWWMTILLALSLAGIAAVVPRSRRERPAALSEGPSLALVVRHPLFLRLAPVGFFCYGGLLAVQALWAGPWLTNVSGYTSAQAANGLLLVNLCMLLAFFAWGVVMPRAVHTVAQALRVVTWGLPGALVVLAYIAWRGEQTNPMHWALWCVISSSVSLSQPALAQALPASHAGRALSTYNLIMFLGVFVLQWGIGLTIDFSGQLGLGVVAAYRLTFGLLFGCCVLSYLWFVFGWRLVADNRDPTVAP